MQDVEDDVEVLDSSTSSIDQEALLAHCAERLVTYKLPRTVEFVEGPLRDDAGKVRRSALREERLNRTAP